MPMEAGDEMRYLAMRVPVYRRITGDGAWV